MTQAPNKAPLDPALVEIDRRWKESGIPGLYDGGDGPVSRERAINIRAFLYPKPKLPQGEIEAIELPAPAGTNRPIPARVVRPVSGPITGTLVYYHGGGWVVGDLDSHEAHAIRLANEAGVVVLNVDYRLAPEHRFPAAVDDAEAALAWAMVNKARLGGADKPLAVGGDSAGGNLAAAVGLYARDHGMALAAQLLIYAATELSDKPGPERMYLGEDAARKALDPRASPLRAATLKGLAPVIIGVGPYDFLYQDNLAYARRLREEGVKLVMREFPTLNHGFFSYTAVSQDSLAAAQLLCADLRALMTA